MSKQFVATFTRADGTNSKYEHAMTISDFDAERLTGKFDKALLALKCIGLKEDQADYLASWKVVDTAMGSRTMHGQGQTLTLNEVQARAKAKIPEQQFEALASHPVAEVEAPAVRVDLNSPPVPKSKDELEAQSEAGEDFDAIDKATKRRYEKLALMTPEDRMRYVHLNDQLALTDDEQEELDAYELELAPNKQDMAEDLREARMRKSKDAYAAGAWAFSQFVGDHGERPHLTSKADAGKPALRHLTGLGLRAAARRARAWASSAPPTSRRATAAA